MRRVPDWQQRLDAVFKSYDGVPFEWGRTDCACFAAACVEAITGAHDVLGTYRGQYDNRLGAAARIFGRGHRTLREATAARLKTFGFDEIPPAFARAGDLGVTVDGVLCVRTRQAFAARGVDGKFYAANNVCMAWRIGV